MYIWNNKKIETIHYGNEYKTINIKKDNYIVIEEI